MVTFSTARRGFTLVEIAFAVVLLGVLIVFMFTTLMYFLQASQLTYAVSRIALYEGAFRSALTEVLNDPNLYDDLRTLEGGGVTYTIDDWREVRDNGNCDNPPELLREKFICGVYNNLSDSLINRLIGKKDDLNNWHGGILESVTLTLSKVDINVAVNKPNIAVSLRVRFSLILPRAHKRITYTGVITERM